MSLVYLPLHPPTISAAAIPPHHQLIPATTLCVEQPSIVISPPPAHHHHQFVERTFPLTIQTHQPSLKVLSWKLFLFCPEATLASQFGISYVVFVDKECKNCHRGQFIWIKMIFVEISFVKVAVIAFAVFF